MAVAPQPIHHVGILGAGQMGAGIAAAHARVGIPCTLIDVDDMRLQQGLERVRRILDRQGKTDGSTPEDVSRMMGRVTVSTDRRALADCDLVIEAIVEDTTAKTEAFQKLAHILRDASIVASNTSTIPISLMARSAPNPGQFAGMHFFHPVDRMELVEIIRGEQTNDRTIASLDALARRLEKVAIVVNDCPGFLTTRLLYFYLREAFRLLGEGTSIDAIDHAALKFGMPMGPIALMDLIGLDTVSSIFKVMVEGYPDRAEPCQTLDELVLSGRLGRKTGAGFRTFDGSIPVPMPETVDITLAKSEADEAVIIDRLFLTMLLEATRTLDEGIVRNPGDIDLGVMLGLAFPKQRGGLLRWADSLGAKGVLDRLRRLESLGERFQATEQLKRLAETDGTFYPREGR